MKPFAASAIEACRSALACLVEGNVDRAEEIVGEALSHHPDDPNLLYVAGNCALVRADDARARQFYERSSAVAPAFPAPLCNLGYLHRRNHRLEEARTVLRACVELDPANAPAWQNLTSTHVNEGEPARGEAVAREALRHCPDDSNIRWNLALVLLEQGLWREGWEHYRVRFDTPVVKRPSYASAGNGPRRLVSPDQLAAGDTVAVHGEQGLGDEILFAGMLGEFLQATAGRGAAVVLDCHPRLRNVFAENFSTAFATARAPAACDWLVPIGDLGGFHRNDDRDFPQRRGYLTVDRAKVAEVRRRLDAHARGRPLVGIAWSGGSDLTHARYRRIPLEDWLPVLRQDACFVSLEYRDCADEIAAFEARHGIAIVNLPELTRHPDYRETFALVAAIDMVVTVPTSVVHVAGALGRRCLVVMHHRAAWRECSRDGGLPWYPQTHRRFLREPADADWSRAIAAAAGCLAGLLPG